MLWITELAVYDAVSLLQCCQRTKYALQSYLGAINFALTRPCFNGIGSPLTLAAWQYIWQVCADSAESAGLDVGVWSHAAEIACIDEVYTDGAPGGIVRGLFTRMQIQTLEPLITLIIQRAELQIDLASVLLVKGYCIEQCYTRLMLTWDEDMEFSALAVALDMTFVHIRCLLCTTSDHEIDLKASIHAFNHPMPSAESLLTHGDPGMGNISCHGMLFWNAQNVLLSAFQNVNSRSIELHVKSDHFNDTEPFAHDIFHWSLHNAGAGGQIRRVARDSIPYTCLEFIEWYGWDLGRTRWNEASPWSVNSTRLAEVLRQSRAAGTTRLQASYTEHPSAYLEPILEHQFEGLC